jgi:hypothetical protein
MSIFNMGSAISPDKERFKDFVKKVNIEEITTHRFILNKILIGDDGDSVPSVFDYLKDGKLVRFTPKKAETAYDNFTESEWKDLPFEEVMLNKEFLEWFSGLILRITKYVDSTDNREKVKNNLVRNFKLMWLNQHVIPDFVKVECINEIERGTALGRKSITLDRIKILDGTDWNTSGYQPKGFDPFEDLLNS